LLKVAGSGPGVSRTRNLLVTSPILYQLDHCTHRRMSHMFLPSHEKLSL